MYVTRGEGPEESKKSENVADVISIVPQKTQIEKLHIFFIVCNVCNLLQFHKKKSVSLSIWMNASLLWWWLYHMSVWPAAAMLSEHASGSGKQMTSE